MLVCSDFPKAMVSSCQDVVLRRRFSRHVLVVSLLASIASLLTNVREFVRQVDEELKRDLLVAVVDGTNRLYGASSARHSGLCRLASWQDLCLHRPLWMLAQCLGECEEDLPISSLKRRTVLEGIINSTACEDLLLLADRAAIPGDGYNGNAFPFSSREHFSGISPSAAAKWAIAQPKPQRDEALRLVQTFVEATRKVQGIVHDAFAITTSSASRLDLDYVQLNCRRAISDVSSDDYQTQPTYVYADNCPLKGDSCAQHDASWFWWRTYSAHLFLGVDDHDVGGSFFYSADPQQRHVLPIFPNCGRVAAYEAGAANLHNNQQVHHGRMCQLSVFLTSDQSRAQQKPELLMSDVLIRGLEIESSTLAVKTAQDVNDQYYHHCRALVQRDGSEKQDATVGGEIGWPESVIHRSVELERAIPKKFHRIEIHGRTMRFAHLLKDPEITLIDGFLNDEEVAHLIRLGRPKMKESTVWEKGEMVTARYRNSKTGWLARDPLDKILSGVNQRIESLTGLSLESAEEMQIASYAGWDMGKYEPHMDWGASGRVHRTYTYGEGSSKKAGGARVATFLMYLNDVPIGGHTQFPHLNLSIAPRAGMAIFWYNLMSSRLGDVRLQHGACPVLSHEKLIATKWIHEVGNEHVFDHEDWSKIATVDGVDKVFGGNRGVRLSLQAIHGRSLAYDYVDESGHKNKTT